MIARLRHLKQPRQLADELLKRFGLADAANRRASTYSGGMRRRLDLAMSLVGTPPILFLDEPTTGLDPEARIEVWKVVKELADGGITVFLTTQYLDEAEQLADRIAILHEGKIIASGTLAELKGIMERFRSMPIASSSLLWGHVLTSLVSNALSLVVIMLVALLMGFRSSAGILSWLAVVGILALFTLSLTWVAVIPGLTAKSTDGATAFSYPLIFLPFISSAFVPTRSMPLVVRVFAENQPVTAIVDSIRALLAGQSVSNDIWVALAWCVGILIVAYIFAMRAYKKRV